MTNRTCMLLADIDWDDGWGRWPENHGKYTSFPVHREFISLIMEDGELLIRH